MKDNLLAINASKRKYLKVFIFYFFLFSSVGLQAQKSSEEYYRTIQERSGKIVNSLAITDSEKYEKVLSTIANQYFQLNAVQEHNNTRVEAIRGQNVSKEKLDKKLKAQEEKKSAVLMQLHARFIALLKRDLTEDQVEKVKDGMTYRILPITYAAYQDMIPTLTKEQKEQIYAWLLEAREIAMDAESSEKKHAVFGKYKGRINNYLSGAGYDLKKEGDAWEKRKKANAANSTK